MNSGPEPSIALASAWWRGSPFQAEPTHSESTLVLLAGAAQHPKPSVRASCRAVLADGLGHATLAAAYDGVRRVLAPFLEDALEPMPLDESDLWLVAALQVLRGRAKPKDPRPLRISSPDALDLSGGVELRGWKSAARVPRRTGTGGWNHAMGPAFHPDLLRSWTHQASSSLCCRVRSSSDHGAAVLALRDSASGLRSLMEQVDRIGSDSMPWWFVWWLFGSFAGDPGSGGGQRDQPLRPPVSQLIAASAQQHSRLQPGAVPLSRLGGHAVFAARRLELRFKTPESIMRLAAAASQPGMIEISAGRPLGWMLLGRGEDEIDFIRAAHAVPPLWAQVHSLPQIVLPEELHRELARWVGPCAGTVSIESLQWCAEPGPGSSTDATHEPTP